MDVEYLKEKTKNLHILYVEDEEATRYQMSKIFKTFFGSVTTKENGLDGLNTYKNGEYDLVITDISMPKMDGITMSEKIKEIDIEQKIIIVSAHNNGDYLLSGIRLSVDGFILKPVEPEQLFLEIDKVSSAIANEKLKNIYQEQLETEVAQKTKKLLDVAFKDELTGLKNRKKLMMDLSKNKKKILMLLNIDNFDNINIAYGYDSGDIILQKTAAFLSDSLDGNVELYRIGHDEFAFLFVDSTLSIVQNYAIKTQKSLQSNPIVHENLSVKFTTTIVIVEGSSNLLSDSHIAFKETRAISKNRIGIYHPNSNIELKYKNIQKYIHIVHNAINSNLIEPFFQPIVNNHTKKIEKYECLARIVNVKQALNPAEFIEIASLSGMLPEITKIMIDKSFKYFQDKNMEFSINISELDLKDNYLVEYLKEKTLQYKINPSKVVLEVLEGISANGVQDSIEQLIKLRSMGFKLAIDDFGAQNSNFERVHRLQVDYIKIDGSFIKNIDIDPNSYNVARSITDFSKSIGAKVIAEYVHSKPVLEQIIKLGIDYSQGYYFGKPDTKIQDL